ncbi:MAG: hypothetical protein QOK36_3073 [Gaiellales bacterium]|jgi:uncharacterized RDD family membrane protein YckC|nr:hypothetical protein [Gaiellales bacterium]
MGEGVHETLRIATPEGVSLELPLAGVGSRFVALLLDSMLQTVAFVALALLVRVAGAGGFTGDAVMAVAAFALVFGYPVAFELGAAGRTPGKRWSSLRVVCDDGSPITFRASALRNLVRLVDALPGFYVVGAIAIFASRDNQRLGDLVAGSIVVREPRGPEAAPVPAELTRKSDAADLPAWDVSGLTPAELAALRRFLERRHELGPVPRSLLARDLADRLRPSAGGVGSEVAPERFLELIAALRRIRT